MKKILYLMVLSGLFLVGCSTDEVSRIDTSNESLDLDGVKKGVIHHVSLGGNDLCEAFGWPNGCVKSFSLVANMMADGTVKGQWQDKFAGDDEGVHVSINCLSVTGNEAVIGGYVTKGYIPAFGDVTGWYAYTAVVDNGTSENDEPDLMSFTFVFEEDIFGCTNLVADDFPLFEVGKGQVKVW